MKLRYLPLGRKAMTNQESILKDRDITLPTKVPIVKAMVFPVVMCGCESWTIKKVEHQRIDAFELWCWKRLMRVPWTARRSNQSILKEISPEYSLEGLILKLQSFGHLMRRADSLEKILMLGKIEGRRRRRWQRIRWLDGITNSGHEFEQTLGDSEGQGSLARCSPWVAKSQTWLSNWTTTTTIYRFTKGYPKSWRRRWGPQHHWMNPFSFTAHSSSLPDQSSIFFF